MNRREHRYFNVFRIGTLIALALLAALICWCGIGE